MSSSTRSTGKHALVERQPASEERADESTDAAVGEPSVDDDTPSVGDDTPTDEPTVEDPHGGFEFDTEPKHHDPVVRIADAFERDEISASVLENADTDALKTFVVRAESGEFDVRSDPALEAAVRIARRLIYEDHRE